MMYLVLKTSNLKSRHWTAWYSDRAAVGKVSAAGESYEGVGSFCRTKVGAFRLRPSRTRPSSLSLSSLPLSLSLSRSLFLSLLPLLPLSLSLA